MCSLPSSKRKIGYHSSSPKKLPDRYPDFTILITLFSRHLPVDEISLNIAILLMLVSTGISTGIMAIVALSVIRLLWCWNAIGGVCQGNGIGFVSGVITWAAVDVGVVDAGVGAAGVLVLVENNGGVDHRDDEKEPRKEELSDLVGDLGAFFEEGGKGRGEKDSTYIMIMLTTMVPAFLVPS